MRATVRVSGNVQGVGFRWWVQMQGQELGLVGRAQNLSDGDVLVVAQGEERAVRTLVDRLTERPSSGHRPGHVRSTRVEYGEDETGFTRFTAG